MLNKGIIKQRIRNINPTFPHQPSYCRVSTPLAFLIAPTAAPARYLPILSSFSLSFHALLAIFAKSMSI